MIDWMFICVLFLAIILFALIMLFEDSIQLHWRFGLVIFDIVLWWSLAAANFEIEIPWEMYNASSGNVETGYHIFSSKTSPALMYIFSAPAVIMFIYMNYCIYLFISSLYKKYLKRR